MFGEGMNPKLRQGLAFGAVVANHMELGHYMNETKFESKYHTRTYDDAEGTKVLVEQGKLGHDDKFDYTKMTPAERAQMNDIVLKRMFPGDANAQARHALALDASADLRNLHKGDFDKIVVFKDKFTGENSLEGKTPKQIGDIKKRVGDSIPIEQKRQAVFEKLSQLCPVETLPSDRES
jgi:hypothetical protein